MVNLAGKKIVIAGSQKLHELSEIIEKHGGTPVIRSLQGITYAAEDVIDHDIRALIEHGADWIMLTTGLGYEALRSSAERLGVFPEFTDTLKKAKVASRGYRTYSFLKNIGVTPEVIADDGSIRNVVSKLTQYDFSGQRVWIQLHGQPRSELLDFIESSGAGEVVTALPYLYQPPEHDTLETLAEELKTGAVDAVCFTTRAQIQYLFDYAKQAGIDQEIRDIFNRSVLAVAVGKVTAEGLSEEGIERVIVPEVERMGGMIVEVARQLESQSTVK